MSDMSTEILSATATARFLGICTACDRPVAETIEDRTGDHATITCPDCGGGCPGQRLYGTMSVDHCNGSCEGARGPKCVCGCGGCNHGGAWAKPGHMLAEQLAAYRTDKVRREAVTTRRREARQVAADNARTLWAAAHADVVEYLTTADIAWSDFLCDLARQVDGNGELTEHQVESVRRNIARQAERDAARAAEAARPAAPVVTGKAVEVEGEVIKVDVKDNPFSGGNRVVMTVRDDRGFKIWGTVPGSITDLVSLSGLKGHRVRFIAGVQAKPTDETFGFFSRPRAATVLDVEIPEPCTPIGVA